MSLGFVLLSHHLEYWLTGSWSHHLVNIGSSNVLLPDRTKPLLGPNLIYHQSGPVAFTLRGFNPLVPEGSCLGDSDVIFKMQLLILFWWLIYSDHCRIMPSDEWHRTCITWDESALVKVMAWCHQAPSHYLSQCWLIHGVTRLRWVKQNCHGYADDFSKYFLPWKFILRVCYFGPNYQ